MKRECRVVATAGSSRTGFRLGVRSHGLFGGSHMKRSGMLVVRLGVKISSSGTA